MGANFRVAVMAIIVNEQGEILIGSSPRDGGFKFPQGGLEPHENSITGIKRELKEELGIIITDDDILFACAEKVRYTYPKENNSRYEGQELSIVNIQYHDRMALSPQDDEFDKLYWIHPKDLSKYDVQFRLDAYTRALELCGLL